MSSGRPWVVLVFGSRWFEDWQRVFADLDQRLREHSCVVVRHGDCPWRPGGPGKPPRIGADFFADQWALKRRAQNWDVTPDRMPVDWSAPCVREGSLLPHCPPGRGHRIHGGAVCLLHGPRRNAAMLAKEPRPDEALGYLQPGVDNKGTRDCAKQVKAARIPLRGIA